MGRLSLLHFLDEQEMKKVYLDEQRNRQLTVDKQKK